MSKPKSKSRYIVFQKKLLRSKAYKSLTAKQIQILNEFYMKRSMSKVGTGGRKKWVCTNQGDIQFTYKEAEKKGFSKSTFTQAIDKLIEVGFLDISQPGLSFGTHGISTKYSISDRWEQYSTFQFISSKRKTAPGSKNRGSFKRKTKLTLVKKGEAPRSTRVKRKLVTPKQKGEKKKANNDIKRRKLLQECHLA
jgi:hypothetical protein